MGTFSIWHWIVVLVIVILIFGTKKLTGIGSDLGNAIKNFKKSMKDEDDKAKTDQTTAPGTPTQQLGNGGRVIDAEVTSKEKNKT
jgi:sec-independent protein translocase protein TatA